MINEADGIRNSYLVNYLDFAGRVFSLFYSMPWAWFITMPRHSKSFKMPDRYAVFFWTINAMLSDEMPVRTICLCLG